MFWSAYFRPHEFGRITATIFAFSTISLILYSQLDLFKEGLDFLSLRFEEAANVEGTPIEAYFNRCQKFFRPLHLQSVYLCSKSWFRISDTSRIDFSHEIRGRFLVVGAETFGLDNFGKWDYRESFSLPGAFASL